MTDPIIENADGSDQIAEYFQMIANPSTRAALLQIAALLSDDDGPPSTNRFSRGPEDMRPSEEIDFEVGQRIRRRREALKISQGKLGRHLGVTFSQIQKFEKGRNRIGAGRLVQIADALETNACALHGHPCGNRNPTTSSATDSLECLSDANARHAITTIVEHLTHKEKRERN